MNLFPAVMVGGPPHSGKSVLVHSLSRALRERGIEHYVLRAAPDGEGDFANEADQAVVRTIRAKGSFSPAYVEHIRRSVQRRHLPLLVDVGGRPTIEQEAIFGDCTHALLLYRERNDLAFWRDAAQRHNLVLIAEIQSVLDAASAIARPYRK